MAVLIRLAADQRPGVWAARHTSDANAAFAERRLFPVTPAQEILTITAGVDTGSGTRGYLQDGKDVKFGFAGIRLVVILVWMNFLATVLTLLCLGACGPMADGRDASAYRAGWGQDRRVVRDVEAMLQGIQQARAESLRDQQEPSVARPGR